MKAFDFAGRTRLPRGPHAVRGPRVGKPCAIHKLTCDKVDRIDDFDKAICKL